MSRQKLMQRAPVELDDVLTLGDRPEAIVGHEDECAPLGPQHPRHLAEEAVAAHDVLQHLGGDDDVEGSVRQRDHRQRAVMHLDALRAQPLDRIARDLESVQPGVIELAQMAQDRAVAAADVENAFGRTGERGDGRVLRGPVPFPAVPGLSQPRVPMFLAVAAQTEIRHHVIHQREMVREEILDAPGDQRHGCAKVDNESSRARLKLKMDYSLLFIGVGLLAYGLLNCAYSIVLYSASPVQSFANFVAPSYYLVPPISLRRFL